MAPIRYYFLSGSIIIFIRKIVEILRTVDTPAKIGKAGARIIKLSIIPTSGYIEHIK